MNVLLYYDYLSEIGGVERVIATHARWLKKAGHDVTLIFNYVDKKAKEYAFLKGLNIQELSSLKSGSEPVKVFSTLVGLNKIKSYNPDLLICYSFPSIYVSRSINCPKAFYYLPMEFIYFPIKKRWLWANDGKRKSAFFASLFLSPILKMLDKGWIKNKLVIANSDFTRREIKGRYNIDSFISYPPLNTVFKPNSKYAETLKKYNINRKFVLTAGRIIPDKRQDWLVEVFAKLPKDLDFVIAGGISDDYKKSLLDLAEKLGVADRINPIGLVQQAELVDLYSACEVFMFASPEEAFGLVPIEAMACGAPVVAWNDNAGPNEYVINKINGFLSKPYDLSDFTEKVRYILKSNFKQKNHKKIVESMKKFSETVQYDIFIKEIENLAKKGN